MKLWQEAASEAFNEPQQEHSSVSTSLAPPIFADYKKRREGSHAKGMAYESPWIYWESCSSYAILNRSFLLSGH